MPEPDINLTCMIGAAIDVINQAGEEHESKRIRLMLQAVKENKLANQRTGSN